MSSGKAGKESGGGPFPSKAQILDFLADNPSASGKREIARAFRLKGDDKARLRDLLRDMSTEGLLEKRGRSSLGKSGQLPSVTVIEVTAIDADGELLARPAGWDKENAPPLIRLFSDGRPGSAAAVGDRVLARLTKDSEGNYQAKSIRRLDRAPDRVLGVYRKGAEGGRLKPSDKKIQKDFLLSPANAGAAEPGDLVLAEVLPRRRGADLGLRSVKVIERLGRFDNARAISLIAIHSHGIRASFPEKVLRASAAAGAVALGAREDLREVPLVTIDGADARDFDDAVHAEPDDDPGNPDGWRILVAIADVAHYVRPGAPLDQEALKRGNSVYFPDRVVPMLPEELSNGWCSLKPGEDRPCMAVWMTLDREGRKIAHRFLRGLMRSQARLTYEAVEDAHRGDPTAVPAEVQGRIGPLYGAYAALVRAREARGTLDLDLPERRVVLNEAGDVQEIALRARFDSHRLIEEYMIAANVAAAEQLEQRQRPCMYRVHETPDPVKLDALAEVLASFGLKLPRGQVIRPKVLNRLLQQVKERPEAPLVHQMILRAQAQAVYSPANLGHFGLALTRYAHFTSPIRRYADLLVHRALLRDLEPSEGKLRPGDESSFEEIGEAISATERRAALAERDSLDRFVAAYLAERRGQVFEARVSSATRFGLFVTLDPSGGDALLPMRALTDDRYNLDPVLQCLVGERWGRRFQAGQRLRVRLVEAEPVSGALRVTLVEAEELAPRPGEDTGGRSRAGSKSRPVRKAGPGRARRYPRRS